MKESTLSKITASVAVAKGMAQKALAASPNPQWTEYEMQSVDAWIARQDVKPDRSEAIRRLVEIGLTKPVRVERTRSGRPLELGHMAKLSSTPAKKTARRSRAQELAAEAIEKLSDASAPPEERAHRRHRLTKGPSEFREHRVDLPKAKTK
ncbi:MAG: hypothetical protein E7813_09505 [Bradyrhizobium sp.]|uniref:hypothetical protein n=1 Tax=Bradyrhizobium sp. TaxID=376 RepID=UPI00121601AF|nr:hypothetical protein [Bradyrhizobium sp.]THD70052.1 MAG: hypothetical protein E7813_09505 [Bradyrhizobium sp.]